MKFERPPAEKSNKSLKIEIAKYYSSTRKKYIINFYYLAFVNEPYHIKLLAICSHAAYQGMEQRTPTLFRQLTALMQDMVCCNCQSAKINLTLVRIGEQPPLPRYQFSPVTSTNLGISPKNFLTFRFNPFTSLVQKFKAKPSGSSKLLKLKQDHPSKNLGLLFKRFEDMVFIWVTW